jgi:hypothetical protein
LQRATLEHFFPLCKGTAVALFRRDSFVFLLGVYYNQGHMNKGKTPEGTTRGRRRRKSKRGGRARRRETKKTGEGPAARGKEGGAGGGKRQGKAPEGLCCVCFLLFFFFFSGRVVVVDLFVFPVSLARTEKVGGKKGLDAKARSAAEAFFCCFKGQKKRGGRKRKRKPRRSFLCWVCVLYCVCIGMHRENGRSAGGRRPDQTTKQEKKMKSKIASRV